MALNFSHYRELGMLGSPGMDSLSGASDMKYPGDCYSPKYVDQRDTYRGKSNFFSERMFLYGGFSLLQSEHPLFFCISLDFFSEYFFFKVEAF